jgi:hypothetical protein
VINEHFPFLTFIILQNPFSPFYFFTNPNLSKNFASSSFPPNFNTALIIFLINSFPGIKTVFGGSGKSSP